VILDTEGNIFGGYTPVEWESRVWVKTEGKKLIEKTEEMAKADDSLKSFLFTLKNPNNIPARIFALMEGEKQKAICCDSSEGPVFGCNSDIYVSDHCNKNFTNFTDLHRYINDTGLDSNIVFTGSNCFQVAEIEIFEMIG
jgi:hypothetical protein